MEQKIEKNYLLLIIAAFIALIQPLGSLVRVIEIPGMGNRSISLISIFLFMLISFSKFLVSGHKEKFRLNPIVNYLSLFFILSMLFTFINDNSSDALRQTLNKGAYYLFIVSILFSGLSNKEIKTIVLTFVLSITFVSIVSFLDYFGFVDILSLNKIGSYSSHDFLGNVEWQVNGMTGFFEKRTRYVNVLLMGLSSAIGIFMVSKGNFKKFMILPIIILLFAGLFSISRGFIVCEALLLIVIAGYAVKNYNTKYFYFGVFSVLLIGVSLIAIFATKGDYLRLNIIFSVFNNGLIPFFFGNGIEKAVVEGYGGIGMHSTIGQIFYTTGYVTALLFGIIALFVFNSFKEISKYPDKCFLVFPIFTWLMYGLLHNVVHTSFIWMMIALLILQSSNLNNNKFFS